MKYYKIFYIVILTIFFLSCKKKNFQREVRIETDSTSNITTNSVIVHSRISDIGDGIISYGHCWDSISNPNISDILNNFGKTTQTGSFQSSISELQPNTNYFVRAYAKNKLETYYGKEITFKTLSFGTPFVETGVIRLHKSGSIIIKSNLLDLGLGMDSIIQYGHCWSLEENPSIQDAYSNFGGRDTIGYFNDTLTNLLSELEYYIKAYAINTTGISYGKQVKTIISGSIPEITLSDNITVTNKSIQYEAKIINNNGYTVTSRGICWNLQKEPTKNDNYLIHENMDNQFSGEITGLSVATTYFIRAFAANQFGTAYSNQIEVKTLPYLPNIKTGPITDIDYKSAKLEGTILNDGGEQLLMKGMYISTSPDFKSYDSIQVGAGSDNFIASITNLNELTTYFVKAYATNRAGTSFGDQLTFQTASLNGLKLIDIDGNEYKYVVIGKQSWMAENLKVTKYNDGSPIPHVPDSVVWSKYGRELPAYCWYQNNEKDFKQIYGALYNWFTVDQEINGNKNICPAGWHIPTYFEWDILFDTLGGKDLAGGKLKETGTIHWKAPNTSASNEFGFSALPGGQRGYDGGFNSMGEVGSWWMGGAEYLIGFNDYVYYWQLSSDKGEIHKSISKKATGYSIRCIKD